MALRREYQQTAQAAEPTTDRIKRIILETLRSEDDNSPCERHSARLDQVEARQGEIVAQVASHHEALASGKVSFESLHKDIVSLAEKVSGINGILKWIGGAIGLGILTTAGSALIWVLANMNQPKNVQTNTTNNPPAAVVAPVKANP